MSETGESKKRTAARLAIAWTIAGAFVVGGVVAATTLSDAAAHAQQVAVQRTAAARDASTLVRADGVRDQALATSSVQAGVIAEQEAAAKKKAAEEAAAKAAAAAAAKKAAEDAAAAAQAAQDQAADDTGGDDAAPPSSSTASGAASGTPLPMTKVTDPNNGHYGQMVPSVDPASWCASGTASTINGVPTCD
jgi:membrane protein involved in colicin uptake